MTATYEHCEYCGRLIPEGDGYCGFCIGLAQADISDLDMIHDPETAPLPHHDFSEIDRRPLPLKKAKTSDADRQTERKQEPTE